MPKTNCNIIKDLLPSYTEGLCSTESRQLVEEHFTECKNCKKIYELTCHEITSTTRSTTTEIDYFKKIKSAVFKKNAVMNVLIVLLFTMLFYCNLNDYRFSSEIPLFINYLFPILTSGILFAILPDYAEHPVPNKLKFTVLGIEFIAMTYIFVLMLYMSITLLNETIPFGMEVTDIGPFIKLQIMIVLIGFIITFVATLFLSIRKKSICPALHFVPLCGISLMFVYYQFLHELSTRFVLDSIYRPYLIFVAEGILLVSIYMFVNRKNRYSK